MEKEKNYYLQLFADGEAGEGIGTGNESGSNPDGAESKGKEAEEDKEKQSAKYTDEDVNKILNRKFAEWEKKQQQKVDEAKRLAEMNAQQKAEYERDQMEKKLNELLRKDALSEMSKVARGMLTDKDINVSDDLVGMLICEDADKTKNAVDSFINAFQVAVNRAVKDTLKGETPKASGSNSGITKEQIMKIKDRGERQKMIREHMDLFR